MNTECFDIIIVGTGASGLTLALELSEQIQAKTDSDDVPQIALISKGPILEGSTLYAQGGIAAVLDENNDTIASHINDTLNAGAGLCHLDSVEFTIERGKEAIQWVIDKGVDFSREDKSDEYHLTREGGHSQRRVIHAADATGKALSEGLLSQVKKKPNIKLFEHHLAVDLILSPHNTRQCVGIYLLDTHSNQVIEVPAKITVLATGGASKVYLYTSNPDSSTGDGIAMAWRAGCRIANMEFNQFHPTCLYHPKAKSFLISEALRGEGAKLKLINGTPFMHKFDEREELAPRDIVAQAIDYEMKRTGSDYVYLDISHKPAEFIKDHFPTIYQRCLTFGIDITSEPIPVVPAAHYTCGGIMTNLDGQTDLENLFAIGETAFTGLHGANRMASNSLLECLVFAKAAADKIKSQLRQYQCEPQLPPWDDSRVTGSEEGVVVTHNWDELRRFMWNYVGIVRKNKRLLLAKQRVQLLQREIDDYYRQYLINSDLIELRNLAIVAELIINSAMKRKESRGLHYTLDYPYKDDNKFLNDTILKPKNYQQH
ncbi:MAG: L-aspartate oxidase [gamma proteobacterium symbiont of Bathyaustriella thionipta]|nr:L-aspartate oxidase [gamma proteobacterium symbiont of Bathyaustriella thionipta]MCU7950482.1 L-aspartate oxidase [gamma proteobacterium symbiont of Bathyaustriella thionipta]MCU7952089.1 L-aspartate oxidase [gamma proteobacterium symbiont of Bathyaustriella thionipta]MCU7956983.1 L-aspartate oxidase [gamma proteobacterium symbiont of Bathyaustriella thionipta]MCU7967082.1 L-aspartate oxidase [gamma proteobacterium symbiont of Bathyaustriella thionipta]